MGISTNFIWNIILFHEDFKYGDGANLWYYVETNTEPLCVEFCRFVQCQISVNYLTFCLFVCVSPLITFESTTSKRESGRISYFQNSLLIFMIVYISI
jgi:hypothetical protein